MVALNELIILLKTIFFFFLIITFRFVFVSLWLVYWSNQTKWFSLFVWNERWQRCMETEPDWIQMKLNHLIYYILFCVCINVSTKWQYLNDAIWLGGSLKRVKKKKTSCNLSAFDFVEEKKWTTLTRTSSLIIIWNGFQFHRENEPTEEWNDEKKKQRIIYKCRIVHWDPMRIDTEMVGLGWCRNTHQIQHTQAFTFLFK